MTIADLKLKIFRQVDSLEGNRLEEFYGILLNYLNSNSDTSDWQKMPDSQKNGILDAVEEINGGKGIPHKEMMAKIRSKYLNA